MPDCFSAHDQKVAAIAAAVKAGAGSGQPLQIVRSTGVSHFVPLPNDRRYEGWRVDVGPLNEVLSIDPESRTCIAEPGISFGELVPKTLALGLIPTVVPELEGITLGGAVAGCSVEAMSHKYGGFHDSCLEYELVTGTGEVLTCSREKDPLVFGMIHGSYGTLAILTRVTFRLVPAKAYVRMEYRRHLTARAFLDDMLALGRSGEYDLIDAVVHGPDALVLCLGRFVDTAPYVSDYRVAGVFYKSTLERTEDYLPTVDYCFRYDADCHWLSRTVPPLEWTPVRKLVAPWLLGSTNLIRWSKRLDRLFGMKKRPDVVCDVFVPARNFVEFFRWYANDFRFFPLWVVPYRIPEIYPWVSAEQAARLQDDMVIDCAIYGRPNSEEGVDWSEVLEEKTFEFGGIKTLISRNHYTAERFWQIYNRENYTAVKARLDPHKVFPDFFEKLHRV